MNEINDENWKKLPDIVMKQTQALLRNISQGGSRATLRDFKLYLLQEGVRSQVDIQALFDLLEMTTKAYKRCMKKRQEN